jgi:ATP-binding cassette subfamily F protein uup
MLDEPTNDLDLPTLRILEEAIIAFEGCVMVVSHDRYFLNRVCSGILALEGNEEIYYSEGDYDYYVEKRKLREKEKDDLIPKEKKESAAGAARIKSKPKKLSYKDTVELESIETKIIEAESEIERIEKIFTSPDFYLKHAEQTNELNLQLEEAKAKVKLLYERWEELEKKKIDLP